jgi:hypothetical protein
MFGNLCAESLKLVFPHECPHPLPEPASLAISCIILELLHEGRDKAELSYANLQVASECRIVDGRTTPLYALQNLAQLRHIVCQLLNHIRAVLDC